MTEIQNENAKKAANRCYEEKYKPTNKANESPRLSKDRYGFVTYDFDIPCEYTKDYVQYCIYKEKYKSTLSNRKSIFRCAIPFLKYARETNILNADRTDLEIYVKYCIDELNLRRVTIEMRLNSIANLIKHIHNQCNPPSRPILTYSMVKDIKMSDFGNIRPPIKRKPLSREEVTRLIDGAGNQYYHGGKGVTESKYPHRDQLIVRVLYETGLRNSDLRGLKLEHYDHKEKLLIVVGSKGDDDDEVSYRVPVRDPLARKLRHWIDVGRSAFLGDKKTEYLFPTERGSRFKSNDSIVNIVKNAAKRADLDGELATMQASDSERSMSRVTPHVLRHSITSHLDSDLEDDLLKVLLGNTSTLDAYRDTSPNKENFDEIRTTLHHLD